jgi:two-component system chemotaxis response regulator CheY
MAKKVLVIDDDPLIRDLVDVTLRSAGFEVSGAPNGNAAMQLLEHETPDAILVDMRMPIMDGRTFLREYHKSAQHHVPVVVFTAAANEATPEDVDGASGVLGKPFELDELIKTVEAVTSL